MTDLAVRAPGPAADSARPSRPSRWQWAVAIVAVIIGLIGGDTVSRQPPRQPFFGLDVPNADSAAVTALAAKLGVTPSVTSVFLKLDSRSVTQVLRAIPQTITPFVTLEPWSRTSQWNGDSNISGQPEYSLRSIIDGTHDAALRALGRELYALHRLVLLRFAHEMNGYWYPWAATVNGNTPAEYQQAWRHVHDLLAPIAGDQVRWVWSPNIVTGLASSAGQLASLYPGDAYVDYLGLTGYSHGRSVTDTFCPTVAALKVLSGKPIVLSEIGSDGPNKTSWLQGLGGFIAADKRIAGFVYFNTSPQTTGATGDYRIDEAGELAALRTSLAELGLLKSDMSSPPRPGQRTSLSC
jgi:mannan endo-1,4-beta-mannosidase